MSADPELIGDLSAQRLAAIIERAGRERPALVIDDGDVAFEVSADFGHSAQAAAALEKVAAIMLTFAHELRRAARQEGGRG